MLEAYKILIGQPTRLEHLQGVRRGFLISKVSPFQKGNLLHVFISWNTIRSKSLDFLNALSAGILLSEAISFYTGVTGGTDQPSGECSLC